MTGFSNSGRTSRRSVGCRSVLVRRCSNKNGGKYEKVADWQSYVVEDGLLVTGQNPTSSEDTAKRLIQNYRLNQPPLTMSMMIALMGWSAQLVECFGYVGWHISHIRLGVLLFMRGLFIYNNYYNTE